MGLKFKLYPVLGVFLALFMIALVYNLGASSSVNIVNNRDLLSTEKAIVCISILVI